MKRNFRLRILIISVLALCAVSSFAATEDPCSKEGIIVKNMTMLDLWYKKNGGDCEIWIHNHVFNIKPEDTIEIFSDLACKKEYCEDNPTYRIYESLDMNGDCRVRILPGCTLSDM